MPIPLTFNDIDRIIFDLTGVQVLVVLDGTGQHLASFGPTGGPQDEWFGLSEFLRALSHGVGPVHFHVTTAHRQTDPGGFTPDHENFHLTDVDLGQFDEIWLFGATEAGGWPDLPDDELRALAAFMDGGGGVFATGDHADLGQPLCGRVPRVSTMRLWYLAGQPGGPAGAPASPDPLDGTRLDTTQPGHDGLVTFDDQSDDIPQPLRLRWYGWERSLGRNRGLWWRRWPHPVMCGTTGPIDVFPDHMHEGEVVVPNDLTRVLTFGGTPFVEYPEGGGVRVAPEIVAWGRSLPHATPSTETAAHTGSGVAAADREFGVVGVYDGWLAGVGRVVVDSTWHHIFDINLVGDPVAPSPKTLGFKATADGQAVLARIEEYYRNVAVWICRRTRIESLFAGVSLWLGRVQPLNEVLGRKAIEPLSVGAYAWERLVAVLPSCLSTGFTVWIVEGPVAVPLGGDPWGGAGQPEPGGDPEQIAVAVLGGAITELAGGRWAEGDATAARAVEASFAGAKEGLRALGTLMRAEARDLAAVADRIEDALQR
jgi:hypothetical protein